MNKAILIGRLTRDPELRTTPTGRNVCQFAIAVNRTYTSASGEREADFINCVVWDKQAEFAGEYVKKGRLVAVEGRITVNKWKDVSGEEKERFLIVANNIRLLGSKKDEA